MAILSSLPIRAHFLTGALSSSSFPSPPLNSPSSNQNSNLPLSSSDSAGPAFLAFWVFVLRAFTMSLNCLTCQSRQTTDPDLENNENPKEKLHRLCFPKADHNWSGPLVSPPREQMWEGGCPAEAATRKRLKGNRGLSTGTVKLGQGDSGVGPSGDLCLGQPRLVRCSGMRRDWSFEELREMRREGKRKERR